jgi:hypothetical protein
VEIREALYGAHEGTMHLFSFVTWCTGVSLSLFMQFPLIAALACSLRLGGSILIFISVQRFLSIIALACSLRLFNENHKRPYIL